MMTPHKKPGEQFIIHLVATVNLCTKIHNNPFSTSFNISIKRQPHGGAGGKV